MTSDPADGPPGPAVRLITVSAAYGAGGSVVAPALAQRLGLPFLQRVTTTEGQVAGAAPSDPPRHGHRAHPHRGPEPSRRIGIRIECTYIKITYGYLSFFGPRHRVPRANSTLVAVDTSVPVHVPAVAATVRARHDR